MSKTKIFIAGHKGMVGSALVRLLKIQDIELITKDRKELDLLNYQDVQNLFVTEKIDQVYLAAAKVGGIHANETYPADFIYKNLSGSISIIVCGGYLNLILIIFFTASSIALWNKNN